MLKRFMQLLHGPIYESRLRELVRRIVPHLRGGDRVLDVGCGFGALGRAILDDPACPAGVEVRGLERFRRAEQMIPIDEYAGGRMPFDDGAFDAVVVADVLHHETEPETLLAECRRVSRRLLIIKDHQVAGPLAQWRIALIDWAANAPYGVTCLYRYGTPDEWRRTVERTGLAVREERRSMNLYPPLVNLLFGRRLQYMVVLERGTEGRRGATERPSD